MVSVVNMVGSGTLSIELDLLSVQDDIAATEAKYDAENYPGLYVTLCDGMPTVTLYRTGSYHISGATSEGELLEVRDLLLSRLRDLGLAVSGEGDDFSVRNVVCVADLEQDLNLTTLAIEFGLEKVEYEPEQFPGLVYRPDSFNVVFLLFGSGKVVITGSPGVSVSRQAFQDLQKRLSTV